MLVAILAGALPAALLVSNLARAAIELLYFQALTEADRIRIEWETATELNNAGFFVLRSLTGGNDPSDYEQITVIDAESGDPYDFIPARGDDLIGAVYIFYDEDVTIGTRYYYFLQDVDSSNSSFYHGPVEVVAGHTPTPTTTAGSPSPTGVTPSATSSSTPTRTNTPFPGFNPTPTPGPSQTPTATLHPTVTFTFTASPIPPLELTLTGIAAALTGLPSLTPTWTASPDRSANPPTWTPTPTVTTMAEEEPASSPPTGRIALVILVFLASGGLLTAGVIYLARGNADKNRPSDTPDV